MFWLSSINRGHMQKEVRLYNVFENTRVEYMYVYH